MSKLVLEASTQNPKGWATIPLGSVIIPIKGKKPKILGVQSKELSTPYITIKAFEKKEFEKFTTNTTCPKCSEKDVLLVWDGARSGLAGTGVSGVIGSTLAKLFCFDINQKYLYYFLKKHYDILNKNPRGIGIPHVNPNVLWNIKFPIPPLNEQKRIVEKIEELFSKIDSSIEYVSKIIDQLSNYKLSRLKTSFEIDAPKELLLDCGEIGTGGTPSRKKSEYYNGKIPWVKTTEVKNAFIYETEEKITRLGLKNSNAKIYQKNSVILAMYGEGKTRGRCAILGISASTNQACAIIVCNLEKLYYKYCFYWLQSQYYQIRAKSSGGNQPNLNLGIVKKLRIPLPDILRQENIVNQVELGLSQLDYLKHNAQENLFHLQKLKNSMLGTAFEGKLVPQDPDDELAEILLQKIKQEKELLEQKQKIIKTKAPKRRRKNVK